MDIKSLRKLRETDSLSAISKEIEKISNPPTTNSQKDDRFWTLERDDAGNGSATIRFIQNEEINELAWTRIFSHGFKGPTGKWYIENSLTTLGQKDPVGELNSELWNSTEDDKHPNRTQARNQKRRLSYIANILVINDPKHPENNGKVKLFRFGKKIFDKITDKVNPTFEDEKPVNVFHTFNGADFKLRIREVEGYANYDKSEFDSPSEMWGGDDQKILETLNSVYPLAEFTAPENFKSYDELKKRLHEVLGITDNKAAAAKEDIPVREEESQPKAAREPEAAPVRSAPAPAPSEEDDDSDMSFFKTMAGSN